MEDVKTDENLADETVYTEDAVPTEKEIEGAEACGDDETQEYVPEEETAEAGSKEESGKKGLFGKKKEKKDPKDEKIEELTDRLQRSMAEFDNYRKRTEKEKSAMFEIGAKDIVERILPVVDNFERGLAAISEEGKNDPFADGMVMIYKQLMKTLEEAGVKPIEAIGKPFDPNFHNAVMHIEDESLGENVVSQELQKGYTYRDSVVRHSMVQVAN
jgi:molecular chaperone GrpE